MKFTDGIGLSCTVADRISISIAIIVKIAAQGSFCNLCFLFISNLIIVVFRSALKPF
jgi:hypothetical protein